MKLNFQNSLKDKELAVFDLDGTLAPTKSVIDKEMGTLLEHLLIEKKVAVIGGGKLQLFEEQFLNALKVPDELLENLFLYPVTATSFFRFKKGWKNVYTHNLTEDEVNRVMSAFEKVFKEIDYQEPKKTYGKTIENRGSQITWSALGQDVVKHLGSKGVDLKNAWRDKNTPLKLKIAKHLQKYLPDLEVHAAGFTSIDVTKKGIDKAYGIRQMEKYLKIKVKNMVFIGDAIFPGGNDYAVTKTPVDYFAIKGPEETKKVIRRILEEAKV